MYSIPDALARVSACSITIMPLPHVVGHIPVGTEPRSEKKAPFDHSQWVDRQRQRRENWMFASRQSLHFKDPAATSKLNSGNPGFMHTSMVWNSSPSLTNYNSSSSSLESLASDDA